MNTKSWRVVGIPGMWSNASFLEKALREVAPPGVEVECLTLRGREAYDAKNASLGTASISQFREEAIGKLRALAREHRLIVVGHSMGGLLALMAGEEHLAEALVLLAPGAPQGICNLSWTLLPLIADVSLHQLGSLLRFQGAWDRPHKPWRWVAGWTLFQSLPHEVQGRIFQGMVGESLRALNENLSATLVAWMTLSPRTPHPRAVRFESVQCPIFMVYGSADRITPVKIGRELQKALPPNSQNRFVIIPSASHWLMEEPCWREQQGENTPLADTIQSWLRAIVG